MTDNRNINLEMLIAVYKNRLKRVKELVNVYGLSYSKAWSNGYVLLREALKHRHAAIAEFLLLEGCKVNSKSITPSDTPLHFAVMHGYTDIVEMLLTRGANVNAVNCDHKTPLHNAFWGKYSYIIRSLLEHGAYVDTSDRHGKTFLYFAIITRNIGVVNAILKYRPNIHNMSNKECLKTAVLNYRERHVEILSEDFQHCSVIVESLLQYGFTVNVEDVNDKDYLFAAVSNGYLRIVEDLLKYGADVNVKNMSGKSPIFYAVENNHLDVTKLLLNNGANADNDSELKIIAVQGGSREMVEILLLGETDINAPDECGRTLLHFTTSEKIIDLLLSRGANINVQENSGKSALHIATEKGHSKVVETLLKCGAEVDLKTTSKRTPLHIAVEKGNLEIVQILLQFNANADSVNESGKTPLHTAVEWRHEKIIISLLNYGSDINIIDKHNSTPFGFIHICGRSKIIDIAKKHIIMLKAAKFYVIENKLQLMSDSKEINDFQNRCEEEIQRMQSEKMCDSNVSLYDILTKSIRQITKYARNENIVQILELKDYENRFPIYSSMISNRLKKGIHRKELLERGHEFFHSIPHRSSELSYNCIEIIFSYLSDEDLRMVINAYQRIDVSSCNAK